MPHILKILSCILTLNMFLLISVDSESGYLSQHFISDRQSHPSSTRLTNPLIGDDEKIYVCLKSDLLVFQSNGSISKTFPLNYTCNVGITPVFGASRMIYLVAENRILRINTRHVGSPESAGEVFLGPETGLKGMDKIIGLAVSIAHSCVLININKRGLFAFNFDGNIKWSIGPVYNRMGYFYGCMKNVTDCYFVSVPAIDYCDSNIYMANNHGEVYSISIRTPRFKWIQDFGTWGKNLAITITAGNNGQLYVTLPDRSVIFALDVLSGTVLWQQSVGPLSTNDSAPVADSNGWISIGSLDGFLYSISPSGVANKFPRRDIRDTVIQPEPVLDCSGYAVYISQTKHDGKISRTVDEYTFISAMKPVKSTITLLVPASGSVYWSGSYPGSLSSLFNESDLRSYIVDESILLAFLSLSNTGNPLSCFSTRQKLESTCSMMDIKHHKLYTGNEKAIKIFLFVETLLLILVAALVRFCCVFWRKKKLQDQNLRNFLEKRSSLRLQKKVFDRTITELKKKAAEGTSSNEVLEQLGDLVRERDGIRWKLSTTYSLGRDSTSPQSKSLIPLSDNKTKSSLKRGRKDSVTISHTISDTSSEDGSLGRDSTSPQSKSLIPLSDNKTKSSLKTDRKESVTISHTISNTSSEDGSIHEEVEKIDSKGKGPMETESSNDDGSDHEEIVQEVQDAQEVEILDEEDDAQSGGTSMRRRSLSLTRSFSSIK